MGALSCHCLLRGGIAFGSHLEATHEGHFFMLSEPLVIAAGLEKEVKMPAVVLHDSAVPIFDYRAMLSVPALHRSILYFEGRWIISPFGIMWFRSAVEHVREMLTEYPEHREKFEWFLRLCDAVGTNQPLIP
jgi:hypothetical protein